MHAVDDYYEFDIYQGDTINMINKNGRKDGTWIDFYNTGEIQKRKKYKNGIFQEGYMFDKNGKVTHVIFEEGTEISTPINLIEK
jgi:antitoxin component YwqK of YwqJK toxin-antitoxin module